MERAAVLRLRSAYFRRVRRFFLARGFLEVDSPLLLRSVPAEATIAPFEVTLTRRRGEETRYLPTSPESGLKQQLATLRTDLFELGHAFRDGEEEGDRHRAHFRMLEWYRVDADVRAIEADTAALLADLADFFESQEHVAVRPPAALRADGVERVTIPEAFARHLDHPLARRGDLHGLVGLAHRLGHDNLASWEEAFHVLVALHLEPHLGRERPTLLCDYPAGIAVQARPHTDRPWLAEQFELFVEGVELGNCYAELTDAAEAERRFSGQTERARAEGRTPPPRDDAFLEALGRLPTRTAGGCLGVERLLMLWLGASSMDDVRP